MIKKVKLPIYNLFRTNRYQIYSNFDSKIYWQNFRIVGWRKFF